MQNPHISDTFKINAADGDCYLQLARLLVGNGIYYPELEYSYDNIAKIYRDVINGKQNDKNTISCLTRYNFQQLFGPIHFNLTYSDDALQSSDPKQLIFNPPSRSGWGIIEMAFVCLSAICPSVCPSVTLSCPLHIS